MQEQELLDIIWILFCSILIFIMRAGFMCLEAGLRHTKNSINVVIKNLSNLGISILLFWAFGFGMMFGISGNGWIGSSHWFFSFCHSPDDFFSAFFIFQAMICAISATIFSGSLAERISYKGYIILTLFIAGVIYPIFGHWAWNTIFTGSGEGWLVKLGFVDFAGSTVVHSVGGWFALAALIVIGPRHSRFPKRLSPRVIADRNLPMSVPWSNATVDRVAWVQWWRPFFFNLQYP